MKAFLKKEWLENVRTYRLFIVVGIFLFFGLTNPLIAKLMPELLKYIETSGIVIQLPQPTGYDAWMQFYKNMAQIQLIVFIVLYSSMLSNEYVRGTLTMLVTKGLKRKDIILSKFTMSAIVWSIAYSACFFSTYLYTMILFPNDHYPYLFMAAFFMYVFGLFFVSTLVLGGVLFSSMGFNLLFNGLLFFVLNLIHIVPQFQSYSPYYLAMNGIGLLTSTYTLESFYPSLLITSILIVMNIGGSIYLFNKKSL